MNPIFPDAQPYDRYMLIIAASLIVWWNRKNMFSHRNAGLSHGFVILGSREFLTKLKKADMSVKRSFLVFWLVPSVTADMKPRMSSDEMTERSMSPKCF